METIEPTQQPDNPKQPEQERTTAQGKACLNCGTPLTGKFCGSCGQKDLPARQDLGDLIVNFISSFFSFESKFFKTFKDLVLKPGKIVNETMPEKEKHITTRQECMSFLVLYSFLRYHLL
jgi:hypothetical protein